MTIDTTARRSRRALIGAAIAGLGAMAAQALGRPVPVEAGGEALILGASNLTDAAITSALRADGRTALLLLSASTALTGQGAEGDAVGLMGYAVGTSATGVKGRTNGLGTQIAVDADTTAEHGRGIAVRARAGNGIALYGSATNGYALQVEGRAVFSRSGKATFTAGQASRTIAVPAVTADSLVVATIQGNVAGTWVRGVSVSDSEDTFTIRLNRSAPRALTVGWFIVN